MIAMGQTRTATVRITARPEGGIRRAGIHHPPHAVDHPAGRLSAEQLARIKADPDLLVEEIAAQEDGVAQNGATPSGGADAPAQTGRPTNKSNR